MNFALSNDRNPVQRVPDAHLSHYHSVQLSLFLPLRGLKEFLRSTMHVCRNAMSQRPIPSRASIRN